MLFLKKLNGIIHNVASILLGIMTVLIIVQVLFRFVLKMPLGATEELARFSMIWLVMLGSTVILRDKGHIAVTLFVELFPSSLQKVSRIVNYFFILAVCITLTVYGVELALGAMSQMAAASKIPMGYIILSIPTFGFIGALNTLEHIFDELKPQKNIKTSNEVA